MNSPEPDEGLILFLQGEGYTHLCLRDGDICGIMPMIFTWGVFVNMDRCGYEYRACYQTPIEAQLALKRFDGHKETLTEWIAI